MVGKTLTYTDDVDGDRVSSEEARRVAVGVVFMDTADPGWWREDIERAIDLTGFDISRPDACALAQRCPLEVLAEHNDALNAESLTVGDMDDAYFVNAVRLSNGAVRDGETLTEWATALGFTGNGDEMPALTAEWARVITGRRKAGSDGHVTKGTGIKPGEDDHAGD